MEVQGEGESLEEEAKQICCEGKVFIFGVIYEGEGVRFCAIAQNVDLLDRGKV